jgi:hypothetical protein
MGISRIRRLSPDEWEQLVDTAVTVNDDLRFTGAAVAIWAVFR